MDLIQRTNRSEWGRTETNVQVTGDDVEFAIVIVVLFALIALIV